MGLFNKPGPTHPPDKWVYMVFLKHDPSSGNDPATMFTFERAGPVNHDVVRNFCSRLAFHFAIDSPITPPLLCDPYWWVYS